MYHDGIGVEDLPHDVGRSMVSLWRTQAAVIRFKDGLTPIQPGKEFVEP